MPPKVKITKNDIIEATLELIRKNGQDSINARSIADALNCSTQPIFSNFSSMEELDSEVISLAYQHYLGFIEEEIKGGEYPKYKSFGMAYIRFAKEEKELFKLLFMCDRSGKDLTPNADFEASVEMIMQANGISREKASLFHLEMWACVHGIGTMLATSYLELDRELISSMLTDVYLGLCQRLAKGEMK
ncbi:MAG: TetR/AcrR family transcriptional regulator [Ruminococcaceae bacterium]|nr:TetR/AcrR family transcriptional regulator [Oscillospiraceae bacterium]